MNHYVALHSACAYSLSTCTLNCLTAFEFSLKCLGRFTQNETKLLRDSWFVLWSQETPTPGHARFTFSLRKFRCSRSEAFALHVPTGICAVVSLEFPKHRWVVLTTSIWFLACCRLGLKGIKILFHGMRKHLIFRMSSTSASGGPSRSADGHLHLSCGDCVWKNVTMLVQNVFVCVFLCHFVHKQKTPNFDKI